MWKMLSKASKISFICEINFLRTFCDCHDKSLTLGCVNGAEMEKLFIMLRHTDTENVSSVLAFEGMRLVHRNAS